MQVRRLFSHFGNFMVCAAELLPCGQQTSKSWTLNIILVAVHANIQPAKSSSRCYPCGRPTSESWAFSIILVAVHAKISICQNLQDFFHADSDDGLHASGKENDIGMETLPCSWTLHSSYHFE
ncbi:uncharacterized protein LOC110706328 [Chenopodium quinoa]|uniref:uncharacterized protein LOC110706328 n=1 Tax=Chenopodium quinoa TaxID=63459 RepID=UPI000B780EDA|nr:uncharacterized protein LOC110706328 [Chenopodium quinoa]